MSIPSPAMRRSFSQRAKRLMKHPIQTLRERRINHQKKEWEIYYAAAKKIGSSEKNAREFADQLSGKALMRSKIKKWVRPTLEPFARVIRSRQNLKEKRHLARERAQQVEDAIDAGNGSAKQEEKLRQTLARYRAQIAQIEKQIAHQSSTL